MPTKMTMASLDLLEDPAPDAQRVAVLQSYGKLELAWAGIPQAGPDEVRVKIKWVGICGSDVEAYRGTHQPEFLSTPTRLGHEVAGVIDQVGENVAGLRIGDVVTCRYVWGAFAEYIVCRPFNVKALPPGFPLKETSLIEVLPGILHPAELGRIDQTKNVLITGQGVSGLILTQVLALHSLRALAVTDLHEKNLDLARTYGATHTYRIPSPESPTRSATESDFPGGFDVVVPCLLEGDGMVDALDVLATGGRIVMYGCIGTCHKPFDFFKLHRKRGEILSTEPKRDVDMRRYFQTSVDWVLDGLVNTSGMITHTFPLERIDEAFRMRNDPASGAIHILIDCERA